MDPAAQALRPKKDRLGEARDMVYQTLMDNPGHPKRRELAKWLELVRTQGDAGGKDPRPPTMGGGGDDSPSAPLTKNVRPAFDPSGETAAVQRGIRGGKDLDVATEEARRGRDPLNSSNPPDPIALQALAGPMSMGVGAAARLAPGVRGLLSGGKLARPIGGALVGAAEGETAHLATGGDATDPTGAILGGAGRGAGELGKAIRDQRSATGRAIQNIEAAGGKTGPGGARGGMFDRPAYKNLPDGDAGTMQMADEVRGAMAADTQHRVTRAGQAVGAAEAQLSGVEVPTGPAVRELQKMRQAAGGGQAAPIDPATMGGIEDVMKRLYRGNGQAVISFDDLRTLVKDLGSKGQYGAERSLTGAQRQRAHRAVSDLQRGLSQEMDSALDGYAGAAKHAKGVNDALYGKQIVRPNDSVANRSRATSRLADVGRETKTGLNRDMRLEEELGAHYGPELAMLRGRNAAESIEFGIPNPGRAAATREALVGKNLMAGQVRLAEPLGRLANKATHPMLLPVEALMLRRSLGDEEEDSR